MSRLFLVSALLFLVSSLNADRQVRNLDFHGKYILGWDANLKTEEIVFDVQVETQGWVGFGLNLKRDMAGADIVIAEEDASGKWSIKDYHATSKDTPILDTQQDWKLLYADKTDTHVRLNFSRILNTCDDEDYIITKDTLTAIWAFGEGPVFGFHGANRGGASVQLLEPPPPAIDLTKFKKWSVRVNDTIPAVHTSYLCSFHKFDAFVDEHHAIGMNVSLENELAVKHTHHFAATNCKMEHDMEYFESLIGKPALDCESEEVLYRLKPFCRDMLFGWGSGGQLVLLPEHVGISVRANEVYYVMLEMHYDNPEEVAGVQFETGFDAFFTTQKRPNVGSILMVGAHILPSLIVPPNSTDFVVAGHCSEEITRAYIPPEGVNLVSVNLHSHLAGRKMRIRHFRAGKELPWLSDDQNYDFNYQQTRELSQEIKFMPGDHLTVECTYDTTWRSDITLAGESTREEMCHAFIFYYPKIRLNVCRSGNALEAIFPAFGIQEVNTTNALILDPIINRPIDYSGWRFSRFLNWVEWTKERRDDLEQKLRFSRHWASFELSHYTDSYPENATLPLPTDPRRHTGYPITDGEYAPPPDTRCEAMVTDDTTTTTGAPTTTTTGAPTTTTIRPPTTTTRAPGEDNGASAAQSVAILLLALVSAVLNV